LFFLGNAVQVGASGKLVAESELLNSFEIAFVALSFATNLFSTLAIAAKLYLYSRSFRSMSLRRTRFTPSQRMLLVLVESGFVFCALQLLDVLVSVISAPNVAVDYAFIAIDKVFYAALALYPMVVILLVNSNNTMIVTMGFDDSTVANTTDAEAKAGKEPQVVAPRLGEHDFSSTTVGAEQIKPRCGKERKPDGACSPGSTVA